MQEVKKRKRKKRRINKIITILLLLTILVLFGMIYYLNVINFIWTTLILLGVLVITFVLVLCNFSKMKGFRLIGYFFSLILTGVSLFIIVHLYNTIGFLFNVTDGNFALDNYNIIVLKDSNYNDIKNLNNKSIGYNDTMDNSVVKKIKNKIAKIVDLDYTVYDDVATLVNAINNNKVDSIILEDSELDLLKEDDLASYENLKILDSVEIKTDIKDLQEAVNINNEPFNIYISGIDTYGKINSSSRSDVNILVTVNPKDSKILITWIPRDYYVFINSGSYKDKLTHAGMYGIDSSIYAVEKLLNVDINYYVKVNFSSVIKIVDVLGGITVYNDETFTTNENITFKKGEVNLNGERALSFVRDRKHVTGGDLGRGKNQIKVLMALIEKAQNKDTISKYNDILKSLNGAFVTNMNKTTMLAFIRKELQSPRNWTMESITLTGTDSYEYTYTYKNTQLYVMLPDEEVINDTKNKIKSILKG